MGSNPVPAQPSSGHQTQVIAYQKLSDGQFALAVCCCDDPEHISWLTLDATLVIDAEKFQASLDDHIGRVVIGHEAAITADETLAGLVGQIIKTDDAGKVMS